MIKPISDTNANSNQIRSSKNTSLMEPSTNSFQKVRSQNGAGILTHVLGFEDDVRILVGQLMGGKKQLQFISVSAFQVWLDWGRLVWLKRSLMSLQLCTISIFVPGKLLHRSPTREIYYLAS